MAPGDDDDCEHRDEDTSTAVGRETLAVVLDSIEKANARASESSAGAVAAVQSLMQRVFIIGLVILLLLGAVLGVAINVDTPSGSIQLDPNAPAGPK
jgi:hypothetical protein